MFVVRFMVLLVALVSFASCNQVDGPQPETAQAETIPPANRQTGDDSSPTANGDDTSSLAIFEKRILPIFQSAKPSSCAECHLSGVDLKDYIRPTQKETFLARSKS